ncbi:H-2 class II histocompatibility antigen, A-U alpha chain-like [Antennarius striatus]|uniref:H-2 class II histocompatibility antigen, A-U alpha chain-like n=1 Tax=Antennarius striatus TaxID=241820 RepID=UPI0035B0C565
MTKILILMNTMMMKIVVLSLVLCVSADSQHIHFRISGCSASDGEEMYSLDSEELWYADFINNRGVVLLPDFSDPVAYDRVFDTALENLHTCKGNLNKTLTALENPAVHLDPPNRPIIYPADDVELGKPNVLICHATGFYPAPVNISWIKNNEEVKEGISINAPFPNDDGSFNQFSRLEFNPEQGDIYSCTLNHQALKQPLTRFWDVEVDQPSIGPAVFCGVGLTVGLVGVAVGTFFLIKGNECS